MSGGFTTNYNAGGVVDRIKNIDSVGHIKNFPQKNQPYNTMKCFDIPAVRDTYTFDVELLEEAVEVLAITLTCSGYGEEDHYDLYFNNVKWFDNWYCSEVKEGLFLGSSTYVYAAPGQSHITLHFKNDSGTSKKVWLGIRMLID